MDISTADGALLVTILRLLHIGAGLIWVGAALLMSLYIEPAAAAAGTEGRRFLRALYSQTQFPRLIPLMALITTVAGLLLYGLLSYHEAMSSAMGFVLTIGSAFGLLAFGHGFFTVWRGAGRYATLLKAGEAKEADLEPLQDKIRRNGRISLWLALVALILMAGARYINPLFG